jgi:hypothetical protein
MRSCVPGVLLLAVLSALAPAARADADHPWDGVWYLDQSRSHLALHSFALTRIANDMWRYDDGSSVCNFRPDGTPYPELYAPDVTRAVTVSGTRTIDMTVSSYGRDLERDHWVIATDGQSFDARSTRIYPDGHPATVTSKLTRVGAGAGFEGKWKEVADSSATKPKAASPPKGGSRRRHGRSAPPPPSPSTSNEPVRPYWIISTSVDTVMTWYIPATGELLRGRADGRPQPLTGPQQPARRTFVWKQPGPRTIEFIASDSGHRIEFAVETLSADGSTFTDTLWAAGHESEKDVRVFRRTAPR